MGFFKSFLASAGALLIAGGTAAGVCYAKVPEFKEFVNKDVLKIEQPVNDTTEKDNQIADLSAQIEQNKLTIEAITDELDTSRNKVSQLQAAAKQDAETITNLQTSITEKQELLDSATAEKSQLEEQKATLEADLAEAQAELEEAQTNAETDAQTIASLQADVDSKQSELADVNSQLETKTTEVETLTTQVQTLTEERDQALADLETKESEIATLNEEIASLESDLATKEVEIASLNSQIDSYKSALNRDADGVYIEDLINQGSIYAYKVSDHKYFVSTGSDATEKILGLYLFDSIDYSLICLNESGYNWNNVHPLGNGEFLLSGENSSTVLFKEDSGEIVVVADTITNKFFTLSDGRILLSNDGALLHLWLYNPETETADILLEKGGQWNNPFELSTGEVLILSTYRKGVLLFNIQTNECSHISNASAALSEVIEVNDGAFISTSMNGHGSYFYNKETKLVSNIYSSSAGWEFVIDLGEGKYLLSARYSGSGILLYDIQQSTAVQVYTNGYYWTSGITMENGDALIYSNIYGQTRGGSKGLLIYSSDTQSISVLDESLYVISGCMINGGALFTTNEHKFMKYNIEDGTVSYICNFGNYTYDVFEETETGITISCSSSTTAPSYFYDNTTGEISEIS